MTLGTRIFSFLCRNIVYVALLIFCNLANAEQQNQRATDVSLARSSEINHAREEIKKAISDFIAARDVPTTYKIYFELVSQYKTDSGLVLFVPVLIGGIEKPSLSAGSCEIFIFNRQAAHIEHIVATPRTFTVYDDLDRCMGFKSAYMFDVDGDGTKDIVFDARFEDPILISYRAGLVFLFDRDTEKVCFDNDRSSVLSQHLRNQKGGLAQTINALKPKLREMQIIRCGK